MGFAVAVIVFGLLATVLAKLFKNLKWHTNFGHCNRGDTLTSTIQQVT
ncbi:exported hypothetical protein [Xenorhabdus nematophila F1]|nr:exported hypothetical protein [Xenorhabdus nematophila F1]